MKGTPNTAQLTASMKILVESWNMSRPEDFLDQIHLTALDVVSAYIDQYDNCPVTLLRFHTHPGATRDEHNSMHTGALATIVDHLSTIGAVADPCYWLEPESDAGPDEGLHISPGLLQNMAAEFGVSRNIGLHVQRPTPVDADILLEVKVLENTAASTNLAIKGMDLDRNVLFTGRHDKIKLRKKIHAKL